MPLQFDFPASLSAAKFITIVNEKADIQLISRHYCLRTYFDSFDWRLWSHGIVCEFNRSKVSSILALRAVKTGEVIASAKITEMPHFPKQLTAGILQDTLQSLLDARALLAVCTLEYEAYQLNLLNTEKKTLLRLTVEEYELCSNRIILQPIRGYEQTADSFARLLTDELGLVATERPVLLTALQLQGRKPADYPAKQKMNIDPGLGADSALKTILLVLLKVIQDNEQGTIGDIDCEFLHDFRVAVRRTRSVLSQFKGVLPEDVGDFYADFFAWLGQVTCTVRDLDVYLSSFDHYKSSLPEDVRKNLDPLYDFLLEKKQKARKTMVNKLKSSRYRTALLEWERFLKQAPSSHPLSPNAHLSIKELADLRIWKLYKRALHQGEAITDQSSAESFHSLRKTCKKLRYLLEFFEGFYSDQQIKHLIQDLKKLQDVLGDFQDFSVQEQSIKLFSEEMMQNNTPATTFLAMGMLIQTLDAKKCEARNQFSSRFEHFSREKNHSLFKSLFSLRA